MAIKAFYSENPDSMAMRFQFEIDRRDLHLIDVEDLKILSSNDVIAPLSKKLSVLARISQRIEMKNHKWTDENEPKEGYQLFDKKGDDS